MLLKTKDLILKPYENKYVLDAYEFFSEEETAKYVLWKPIVNINEAKERLKKWSQNWNLFFLIIEKTSDKCVGYIGVDEIEKDVYGRLGIGLGVNFKGKGYGTQALSSLIEFLKLNKAKEIHYSYFKENFASEKLAKKLGFKFSKEGKRIRKWDNKEFEEIFYVLKLGGKNEKNRIEKRSDFNNNRTNAR